MGQPPQPGQGAWPPQGQPYNPQQPYYPQQQQYPQQPRYPQQQYPPPGPPRPPKKPKWPWLLAIGLVLVLLVAAGAVALLMSRSKPKTGAGTGSTASRELKNIPRKGYGEQSDGVADPAALVEKENPTPVRHAAAAIIPACTLLSLTDLARNGLLVLPNPLALPYSRTYFDNQGTGPVERGSDLFVPIRPSNSCSYGLAPRNSVSMDVFQESYINPAAMVYSFKRYRPAPSIDGVKVTKSTSSDGTITSYTLRLGGTLVDMHTSLPDAGQREVLKIIAGNLRKRTAQPAGNPALSYGSPLLPVQPAVACAVTKAEDFRALFNRPAAPFVEEQRATAVGRVDFSINTTNPDKQQYAYVETVCRRFNGDVSVDRYVLSTNVTSYTAPAAAANKLRSGRGIDVGKPVGKPVGDEAYCATRKFAKAPGTLVFSKGRFVVALTLSDPGQPDASADPIERCQRLARVADRILPRLGG